MFTEDKKNDFACQDYVLPQESTLTK